MASVFILSITTTTIIAILVTVCCTSSINATVPLPDYMNRKLFTNDRYPSGSSRLLGSLYPSYEPSVRVESSAGIPGIVAEDLTNRIIYPKYLGSNQYDFHHYPHTYCK